MTKANAPTKHQIESQPRCCPRCFGDRSLKSFIGRYGMLGDDCDFCEATGVRTLGVEAIAPKLWPLFEGYTTPEPGTHYIPELQEADGDPLDYLLDGDNPDLFSSGLVPDRRQGLVQALLDVFDADVIAEGWGRRYADDLWVSPGSEIWAGAEDEWSFLTPPERWRRFVLEISHKSRYFRLDPEIDPQTYLTPALLKRLSRRLAAGTLVFRAASGGDPESGHLKPRSREHMAGPNPEHSKEAQRVNAAGVPVLYAAKDVATVIAEMRLWVGAPVSVASLYLERTVRLVDFSPRRRRKQTSSAALPEWVIATGVSRKELDDILETIGAAMARPIAPDDHQVLYVPTQYVAEVVRRAGYDGVMFKSAVGPGVNVVLFNKKDARVDTVELHRVNGVK